MSKATNAVAIAAMMLAISASRAQETHGPPSFNGTPVDYCLRHGDISSCGRESANAYCVAQGQRGVVSYKGYVVVPQAITMSGQTCSGTCWAFENIECGEPGPGPASTVGAVVPAPPTAGQAASTVPQGSAVAADIPEAAKIAGEGMSITDKDAKERELLKAKLEAENRRMLRGYASGRPTSLLAAVYDSVFGRGEPFRVFFHMTANRQEALDMIESGRWHGRDPEGARSAGFPTNYLGACSAETKLKRPSETGMRVQIGGPQSNAIEPPPLVSLGVLGDYETGCMGVVLAEERAGTVPLYRYIDQRNGAHFFTLSAHEGDNAVRILGFKSEGTCCFVPSGPGPGIKPIYRVQCSETGHFYTSQLLVKDWMVLREQCTDEGIAFHVWES
jgi:Repeat of unknown function (DUF5648)